MVVIDVRCIKRCADSVRLHWSLESHVSRTVYSCRNSYILSPRERSLTAIGSSLFPSRARSSFRPARGRGSARARRRMTDANGRATILPPGDKINGGEHTLEELMARIESLPANKRLLRQIGVRESLQRVRDEHRH